MNRRCFFLGLVAFGFLAISSAQMASAWTSRTFAAYAPPGVWGGWVTVASHAGKVTYSIRYAPEGNTTVFAEVSYESDDGNVDSRFMDNIVLTTGNVAANVRVRFRGDPFGSAVRVSVSP